MASVKDLELPFLPLETAEFGNDPMPYLYDAWKRHSWLATSDLGIVISEHRAIDDILRLDDSLKLPGDDIVDIMGAHGTGWGQFALDQMLASSGERHARLRNSVAAAFRPNRVKQLREVMRSTVMALLDDWVIKGSFDFVEFAGNFPVRVMFSLLGAPVDRLPEIMSSLEVHGGSFNMDVGNMANIEAAYQKLWGFVDELISGRVAEGEQGDLLDELIGATSSGQLNDVELRQMLILLFAAGYDTSKNVLSLLMHSMLQEPDIWRRCAVDAEYCRKVVKEQLRFASPSSTYRIVTKQFEYRGVVFPEGSMLFFPLSLSGRDPKSFSEPERFNPERTDKGAHQAFGRGMHICLGQFLAVANVEEGAHLIAQRITNPRLAGEVVWRRYPGTWGVKSLPISFDPR